jgi:hypothetical protein
VDDKSRLSLHMLPELGSEVLKEIRPRRIRSLLRELKARCGSGEGALAPRTVRNIYGALHRLFEDAVADELIDSNPCVLSRDDLPEKVDKDPTWRAGAIYAREEVELLISDGRIPEDRRVLYALFFLGGVRFGAYFGHRDHLDRSIVITQSGHRDRSAATLGGNDSTGG